MDRIAVVTGGGGFIGTHLCTYLIEKNYQVICIDNFCTGRKTNITHLLGKAGFGLIKEDVTKPLKSRLAEIHIIYHLASPASPMDYATMPVQTLLAGALGTYNMLEIARKKDAAFLFTSSSEVYGSPKVHPQTEDYYGNVNPVGVRSVYDEAKRFGEALTMAYNRVYGLDTKIARIFNTYGPFMRTDDGRAIPTFINQALRNNPLTVFGNGSQTRSFCYITDLIEGLYKLGNTKYANPINLGNTEEITILNLAKLIISLSKSRSKIVFKPLPADDPPARKPDIKKAKAILGWRPKVDLQKGLRATIEWFEQSIQFSLPSQAFSSHND